MNKETRSADKRADRFVRGGPRIFHMAIFSIERPSRSTAPAKRQWVLRSPSNAGAFTISRHGSQVRDQSCGHRTSEPARPAVGMPCGAPCAGGDRPLPSSLIRRPKDAARTGIRSWSTSHDPLRLRLTTVRFWPVRCPPGPFQSWPPTTLYARLLRPTRLSAPAGEPKVIAIALLIPI